MDEFLNSYDLPKLNQGEIKIVNRLITSNVIEKGTGQACLLVLGVLHMLQQHPESCGCRVGIRFNCELLPTLPSISLPYKADP